MGRLLVAPLVAAGIITLSACANFNTIDRTTRLPTKQDTYGQAVHLDIQQRLMIVNEFGKICSEPSPDALAAYAAALGIGASVPAKGAVSAALSAESSAAAVGLRTQSITLMRDALYRVCEAYANDVIGREQIAALLSRSQDLTAVILAVEQLTGPAIAGQAALTGSAAADATAIAQGSAQSLEDATEAEERAQARLEQAEADLVARQGDLDAAQVALAEAQSARDALGGNATPQQESDAQSEVEFRQAERDRAQRAVDSAQRLVETRRAVLERRRTTREEIAARPDSASTAAGAETSGQAQFSAPRRTVVLDKAATEAIAGAVESIVTEVLRKEYAVESCMAIITAVPPSIASTPAEKAQFTKTQDFCFELVLASTTARTTDLLSRAFAADETSDRIDDWLKLAGNRERLQAWLNTKEPRVRVFALLQGDFRALRDEAIAHFNIP